MTVLLEFESKEICNLTAKNLFLIRRWKTFPTGCMEMC